MAPQEHVYYFLVDIKTFEISANKLASHVDKRRDEPPKNVGLGGYKQASEFSTFISTSLRSIETIQLVHKILVKFNLLKNATLTLLRKLTHKERKSANGLPPI